MLIKASEINIIWNAHFNLAGFYLSGLDGATKIDQLKSVYHYICAWKLVNDEMCKSTQFP